MSWWWTGICSKPRSPCPSPPELEKRNREKEGINPPGRSILGDERGVPEGIRRGSLPAETDHSPTKEEPSMAKKGMKRPGYTGPEAQNSTANPQNPTGRDAKNKSNPNQSN